MKLTRKWRCIKKPVPRWEAWYGPILLSCWMTGRRRCWFATVEFPGSAERRGVNRKTGGRAMRDAEQMATRLCEDLREWYDDLMSDCGIDPEPQAPDGKD